jgi:hypothetical protein
MAIEMLLNDDIQLFFIQIILNFQKEIKLELCTLLNYFLKNSNHFI